MSALLAGQGLALEDFREGDHLIITGRSNRGEEKRAAIVCELDRGGRGEVRFSGRFSSEMLESGQGSFRPENVGTTRFGLCVHVEIVGHSKPSRCSELGPAPGDRSYDSLC